jgi:hypothetical protein
MVRTPSFTGCAIKARHAYIPLLPAVKTSQPLVVKGYKNTKIKPFGYSFKVIYEIPFIHTRLSGLQKHSMS